MAPGKEGKKTAAPGRKKVMADTMTCGEMAAHRRRNGIVLLPVGCFEMHGVQVGMGCDTFEAEAACRILAEELDAIVMPAISYTFAGATGPWPGTVNILPQQAVDYVTAVVKSILKNGFKRVVLVSIHGPSSWFLQAAVRTIFEETGEIPIVLHPRLEDFWRWVEETYGRPHSSAASYLAALHICDRHGEFDPAATEAETLEGTYPFESQRALARHGVAMPYRYVRPQDHVGRYPGLAMEDAPRLAEEFRRSVAKAAQGLPEDYAQFQKDMRQAMKKAPWADLK